MSAPQPPGDLATRALPTTIVPARTPLHRFHNGLYGPVFFDRSLEGRLNAPDAGYGVLYVARQVEGAFAESFRRNPGSTLLASDFIASKAYAILTWDRPLVFVNLHGKGHSALGSTAEVTHGGKPYDTPQTWSRALFDHPETVDGIAYRARHDDDEICYAVFERAGPPTIGLQRADLNDDWFYDLMDAYGVGLI